MVSEAVNNFSIGLMLFSEPKFRRITLPKTLVLFLHTRQVPEATGNKIGAKKTTDVRRLGTVGYFT